MSRRRAGCGIPLRAGGLAGGRGTGERAAALLRRHERRLSVFNLLPSPPLDGGRIVQLIFGDKAAEIAGLLTASAVFLIGFAAFISGRGAALFIAGALLLVKNI